MSNDRDGTIKALTLWQPWATMMALGFKTVETRSWSTDYRGPLAIHAAQNFPAEARKFCRENKVKRILDAYGYGRLSELPRGVVVAYGTLADVLPAHTILNSIGLDEHLLGEYSPGRFAWRIINCHRLLTPIPAKGKQRLWNWGPPEWLMNIIRC